tara:strand:+ start:416 stop:751 length:336 start_codon:yes stop_codon:yes gene_type:complete
MKKENLKYIWLAIFVTMVCTIITCQGEADAKKSNIEIKEAIIEDVVEPLEEKVEEVVEPLEVEQPTEEVEVEEVPVDLIPPVDTLERKEFYDENDWKYDETVPAGDEDGQD